MSEPITTPDLVAYEYGAMSSRFRLRAANKLTAYAAMCGHYERSAHLLVIYEPESSKADSWTSFDGKISDRLDEIFGGEDGFDKYCYAHVDEIRACYNTIERLV